MTGRDRQLEHDVLGGIERTSRTPHSDGFGELVTARLNDAGRRFRDTFQHRAASDLLVEAGEESLDLVGWSLLALTVAQRAGLDDRALERLHADVHAAAVAAQTAFAHVNRAIGLLSAEGDGRP